MRLWDKLGKIAEVAIEKAPDVMEKVNQKAMQMEAQQNRQLERNLKEYERRIQEDGSGNAGYSEEQKKKIEAAKIKIYGSADNSKIKSINEWNLEWECIGNLETANLTPYNNSVGLYRHVIGGRTMYIGRAIELNNGGFRKRLSDYRRDSNSARKHTSGRLINDNLSDITTYILIVGYDEEAVQITKRLEGKFIAKYKPEWNKNINI